MTQITLQDETPQPLNEHIEPNRGEVYRHTHNGKDCLMIITDEDQTVVITGGDAGYIQGVDDHSPDVFTTLTKIEELSIKILV